MDNHLNHLQQTFLQAANSDRAIKMAAYMLNQFEFLGIEAPKRRLLSKEFIKNTANYNESQLLELVIALWELPQREFQYVAIDLMIKQQAKLSIEAISPLVDIAVMKSWWDSVDGLAQVINRILKRQQASDIQPIVEKANASDNLWVKRIAILHQLGWKQSTNTHYLYSFALQNAANTNFFIRKAIGWSLRDYAKHNPAGVYDFVEKHKILFSPLTYREATKHQQKYTQVSSKG